MLRVDDLTFAYDNCDFVLDGLSFEMAEGEILSLLGPSGCGKSTVLRLVAGLLVPNGGAVEWQKEPELAFVFQDHALMPWATLADNVALPGRLKGRVDDMAVQDALAAVGLTGFEARYPLQLSGGQRMRASVARALASNPTALLMDEPFAALDEILRFEMNDLLLALARERGLSLLFVTHSLFEATYLSDRVLVMRDGRVAGEVTPSLNRELDAVAQRSSPAFYNSVTATSALMKEARP